MNNIYPKHRYMQRNMPRRYMQSQEAEATKPPEELVNAVNRSHEILYSASTVFPFTLFPDTATIDREKLTLTKRMFFGTAETMSIRIDDILNVTADVGPFFGSIKISTRFFDLEKPYAMDYLKRKDAMKLKQIIQGYIIAIQERIDCSAYSSKDLARMLMQLGSGGLGQEI
jgi:predicted transcriptional regulator